MKADFLFVGLNLNTYVQEKTPETCTFHGWCFKKEHEKYLNVEIRLVVVFPSPNKILATRLDALLVLLKDLVVCFWFDLCGDCSYQ